jgi:hypothetical protein
MNIRIRIGALLSAIALATMASASGPSIGQQYISMALQGDLHSARDLFAKVPPESLSEKERTLSEQFNARFVRRDESFELPSGQPFAAEVIRVYRDYWTKVLMKELSESKGEAHLKKNLRAALKKNGVKQKIADDAVLDRVKQELEADGLHVLGGMTRPYLDLMLWTTEETRQYECQLTDAVQPVEVVFLDDFLVMGWSHFATFGRAYTGGWAGKDQLFCLRDDYDLESEKFKVSYLQHEARHFADYKIFPKLEQIDLEYRGKLTELAFADTSLMSLITHFAASGAYNEAAPHSYANACVIRDLSRSLFEEEVPDGNDPRWKSATPDQIHAAARGLLEKNTKDLIAAGADTTRGILRPS